MESELFIKEMVELLNKMIVQEDYYTAHHIKTGLIQLDKEGKCPKGVVKSDSEINLNYEPLTL